MSKIRPSLLAVTGRNTGRGLPKRQDTWFVTNQQSAPEHHRAGTQEANAQGRPRSKLVSLGGLSGRSAGRRVERRRSGVLGATICQGEPRDRRGRSQDRGHAAGQYRHMGDMADRASGFRTGRVGMPERGADAYGKDGHQRSHKCRAVKPSKMLVMVAHYQRRTATHEMLTQTLAAGKRSPQRRALANSPADQEWVGSGTIERGWRSTAGASATVRGPGSAAADAACRAGSERSSYRPKIILPAVV